MTLRANWTKEDFLKLTFLRSYSSADLVKIIESYDSFKAFRESDSPYAQKLRQVEIFQNDKIDIEAERQIELCSKNNYQIISFWDEDYPELLKKIPYPPLLLFVNGTIKSDCSKNISIVGTRKNTQYGKFVTEQFVEYFVKNDIIIISGLAYGIDSIAHRTTLKNDGITYAVVASGLDEINPQLSRKLSDEIVANGGAIITEYRCGTKSLQGYFPQRNRIISGLPNATIVIESAKKGGALITANFAFDQNRELYAVPGNINSERSKGTNLLIKNLKAQPAISPELILEDLGILSVNNLGKKQNKKLVFKNINQELVYNSIDSQPIHIDEIVQTINIDISELLVILLELEFDGFIKQLPGKYYIKGKIDA
jgi:DNA processing protein